MMLLLPISLLMLVKVPLPPQAQPFALLPSPTDRELSIAAASVNGTLANGLCTPSGMHTCTVLIGYSARTGLAYLLSNDTHDAFCSTHSPPAGLYPMVTADAMGKSFEAYYLAVYSDFDPAFVFPIDSIDACCPATYFHGLNPGELDVSGSATPGSTVTFHVSNAQSPQASCTLLVATEPRAPRNLGFGFLHVAPTSIVAVVSTGLMGNGDFDWPIPPDPALLGKTFYTQAILQDPSAATPQRLTNGVVLPIR